jgi:hypothetical protein
LAPGQRSRTIVLAILLTVAVALVGAGVCRLLRGGHIALPLPRDLLAYWGSARLLFQRQDPYDLEALLELQQRQGWPGEQPVVAWNPPLLQVLWLPLAALPFPTATAIWLLANPLIIGLGAICAWRALSSASHRFASLYVPILTFSFAGSVHSMVEGQVICLVLLGLGAFLLLRAQKREFLAGASCVLWLVKPHLVYLLLPLFLLDAGLKRR